jgi:uncharacterized membrane protein
VLTTQIANAVPWLDDVAEKAQSPVQQFFSDRPALHNALEGTWLGVPLHPALTDVPVGAWTSALVPDLVATATGSEAAHNAADGALAVGIAGALPAAVTGVADWRDLIGEERRIATVHALLNVVGLSLSVASLVQRRRGNRGAGRALSAAAMAISGGAAHLGGELSFGMGVRVNHTFVDSRPSEFASVLIARAQSGQQCAIANASSKSIGCRRTVPSSSRRTGMRGCSRRWQRRSAIGRSISLETRFGSIAIPPRRACIRITSRSTIARSCRWSRELLRATPKRRVGRVTAAGRRAQRQAARRRRAGAARAVAAPKLGREPP